MPPAAVQRVARILRPGQRHAHRASVAVDARHALEALCPGHRAATLVGSAVVCNRLAGEARPTLSNHESRITNHGYLGASRTAPSTRIVLPLR
jgi:hypothetical protein